MINHDKAKNVMRYDNIVTRRDVLKAAGASGVVLGSAVVSSGPVAADHTCSPEPGLQGQVPLEAQDPDRDPFCRNMHLVGQNTIEDRGANFQLNWYGDYAYVGMAHQADRDDPVTDDPLWGTAVIDASDPENPEVTSVIQTPAHFNTWEALSVNERRDLMVCSGNTEFMDIHDLSNPAEPELLSSIELATHSHGLILSTDGRTAYISAFDEDPGLVAYDISNPVQPELLATHPQTGHDPGISYDGDRLYLADHGVKVFDISEIEHRMPNPEFKRMGEVETGDISHAGETFRKNGREFFLTQDEVDSDDKPGLGGGCPWGFARITDVTDGENPCEVGQFRLEVNNPENGSETKDDNNQTPGLLSELSFYSAHYSGIDRDPNPNTAFFSWYASGVRVADIRDIEQPEEIAYFNPAPNPDLKFGDQSIFSEVHEFVDSTTSYVRYRPKSGHIWFVSDANGFQIAELTGPAKNIPTRGRGRGEDV